MPRHYKTFDERHQEIVDSNWKATLFVFKILGLGVLLFVAGVTGLIALLTI